VPLHSLKELMEDSRLVFVGKVLAVEPSRITTTLCYPTYDGALFKWLRVDVKVIGACKGVQRGEVVHALMMSMEKATQPHLMYCPPGTIEPDKGDILFLCLAPTPITNMFAALTAPYDEDVSVIPLYRSQGTPPDSMRDDWRRLLKSMPDYDPLWRLVNDSGHIQLDVVAAFRDSFAAEIAKQPTNDTVYLEWQAITNAAGWTTDVPRLPR